MLGELTMMDKIELIEKYQSVLKALNEPGHNVLVSSGSALVILGVRNKTDTLNVNVPPNVFKYLSSTKTVIQRSGCTPYIQLDKQTRAHPSADYTGVCCVEGIWLFSVSELIKQKKEVTKHPNRLPINKLRDQKEIDALEVLLKSNKTTSKMV